MHNLNHVLVFGTGRSGTSSVARVLHQNLGISMGVRFREPDGNNPEGVFEDLDFVELNRAIVSNQMPFSTWLNRINAVASARNGTWGLKDPRLCYLLPYYLAAVPDAKLVVCVRNSKAVVDSWLRCYGGERIVIEEEIKRRLFFMRSFLKDKDFVSLDFNQLRSDDWIESELAA